METNLNLIKSLREETGLGIMDCKRALEEAGGDVAKARAILKRRGAEIVAQKSGRSATQGIIASYVHQGDKIGVLVEVNCETDFVARNDVFRHFSREICLQVAASNPRWVSEDEVPEKEVAEQQEWVKEEYRDKPPHIQEKIAAGKLADFYKEVVLLRQPYIREPEKTIKDYLEETSARLGEKIAIRRFVRWELGT